MPERGRHAGGLRPVAERLHDARDREELGDRPNGETKDGDPYELPG